MKRDPIQALTSAIVACGSSLVREATRLFKPFGVTVAQFDVLELLANAPKGLRPSELAASLVVDPSSTTYLVDQIEKRGWIRRADEPDDRRAYRVVITDGGRTTHAQASKAYRAALSNLEQRLGMKDLHGITQVLNQVSNLASGAADVGAASAPSPKIKSKRPGQLNK